MRPVKLELEGFATFRNRTELDFDGLDLVAFTGPTGAGKSSLIDAITFALYGSVARYGDARKVAPVIHQLATDARVRLDFESGGVRYTATRVVRRQTGKNGTSASTREARLEQAQADGSTIVLAGTVKELDQRVPELLGLDFDQFTRTIVLPQGEFASFLRDDQASRDKLLQRLLDLGIYERLGQAARSRAKTAADQIKVLADRLERIQPPSESDISQLSTRLDTLATLRASVDTGVAELSKLDADLDPLRQQVKNLDRDLERLQALTVPEGIDGVGANHQQLAEAKAAASANLVREREAREATRAALADLPSKADLNKMLSVLEQLSEAREEQAEQEAELVDLTETVSGLERDVEKLEAEEVKAEADLRRARQAADAASWTETLELGEPCPVCYRDVEVIPDHDVAGELERIDAAVTERKAALKTASRQLARMSERKRVTAKEIERSAERIELLQLQQQAWTGPADREAIHQSLESVAEAEQRLAEAESRALEAERGLAAATDELETLERQLAEVRNGLTATRDTVADLGPPSISQNAPAADARALLTWRDAEVTTRFEQRTTLADQGKRMAEQRKALVDRLTGLAGAVGIDAAPTQLVPAVAEAAARTEAELTDARRRQSEHQAEAERVAELEAARVLDAELGRHLRAGGFTSWLLAEALDAIVAKASVWLQELSNSQYSLVAGEKAFAIVDHHNAAEQRDVRTLSGGETFLASLALALALADSVAELAPVDAPGLDSMFLDEGFGTLDPATLDVVATAIEELASSGRMIGIVTHVADLAERMPARFRVSKGPATSTVELVLA